MANAATMAGMAFANAFLGVMHSMAHKLGAFHHIPHGWRMPLMMDEVIRFNAAPVPTKMGTFPQYDHPKTMERYAEIAEYLGVKAIRMKKSRRPDRQDRCIERAHRDLPTIRDYAPDEADFLARLDAMTEQADDQCTGANPRYPLMSEIKQMYLNAYYGKHFEEKPAPDVEMMLKNEKTVEVSRRRKSRGRMKPEEQRQKPAKTAKQMKRRMGGQKDEYRSG